MAYLESTSGANLSSAQAVTATAPSTNVFDVTGAGAGNLPTMIGAGGLNTALGFDIGGSLGNTEEPVVLVTVTTATTVTGTLTIALQVAADNGSGSPGSYFTIMQTAAFTGATELFVGAQIVLPIPAVPAGLLSGSLPRFYRLNYTVGSSISVVLSASILLDAPNIRQVVQYGSNFPSGL